MWGAEWWINIQVLLKRESSALGGDLRNLPYNGSCDNYDDDDSKDSTNNSAHNRTNLSTLFVSCRVCVCVCCSCVCVCVCVACIHDCIRVDN